MFHFTYKKGMGVLDFTDALSLFNNGMVEEAREYILQTLTCSRTNEGEDFYLKNLESYLTLDEDFVEILFNELEKLNKAPSSKKEEPIKEKTKQEIIEEKKEVKKTQSTKVTSKEIIQNKLELAVAIQNMLKNESSIATNNDLLKQMIFNYLEKELCKILGEEKEEEFSKEEIKVLKSLVKKILEK